MQLAIGKSIVLTGLNTIDLATDSMYDDEAVRKIMEWHYEMMKVFGKRLKKEKETRSKWYEDIHIKEGDFLYYQHQDKKAWSGPVKVFAVKGRDIFIFANRNVRKVLR